MLNAQEHKNVTILFADVCNYTEICEKFPMIDNVNMLNKLFTAFDSCLYKYNIEQVQIIGDAYMAISGHEYNIDDLLQATNMLRFAIDILGVAKLQNIKIRIGISCGSVISAKLGINNKTVSYYGDTVNMASRMESHGYPWCIHVSQMFIDKIIDENAFKYNFVQLGYRLIKGKGRIITYLYCIDEDWEEALSYFKYKESHSKRYDESTSNRDSFQHNHSNYNKLDTNNYVPRSQSSYVHNERRESTMNLYTISVNNISVAAAIIIQRYWRNYKINKCYKIL